MEKYYKKRATLLCKVSAKYYGGADLRSHNCCGRTAATHTLPVEVLRGTGELFL
jgi:hypothetical protein